MTGRIVHIGLGNFARAHLLDYTADAGGWDVVGVSLRSHGVRDGLARQGFAYDLCVQGVGIKRINVLRDVLVAPHDPQAVLAALAVADIISITVTEKGYHLTADGNLDLQSPAIQSDLRASKPETLIGFLAHALVDRTRPVTILSCDNMVANGATLHRAVRQFGDAAGLWCNWQCVRFPNAMVDRITPATTDSVRAISGDPMAVATESFREWVIENDFAGPRPNWPEVRFVDDVAPHELRKLRMLNGAHSFLAYAGLARGHQFVHEAIADPILRPQVQRLMAEAGATLPQIVQDQVPKYAQALVARFENPELHHRLDQIAMDGSQKVPYRLIQPLRIAGDKAPMIAMAIRAWIVFCSAQTKSGVRLNDPLAEALAAAAQGEDATSAILRQIGAEDVLPLILE